MNTSNTASDSKNMKGSSRVVLAVAAVALLILFTTPIWKITLEAPQYPEGIGMYIRIDNVTGIKPNDLKNINQLNHYIGMKEIVPEAIPELKWMPWIILGLAVLGVAAAASGKRPALYTWTILFVVIAVVGLVDFYMWEYDYGHDLDLENAAIQVPGMTYTPPLIGSKKLLNFTANSWPYIGGWVAFLSMGVGIVLSWTEWKRGKASRDASGNARSAAKVAASLLAVSLFAGCTTGPAPIHYGEDTCDHCRMVIAEPRFAMELVTSKGKVYKFDAIECAAAHELAASTDVTAWVHAPEDLETWIRAANAEFIQSAEIHSPMGAGLAVAESRAETTIYPVDSQLLSWTEVVESLSTARAPGIPQ